jgi:hypothetical protein
MSCREGALARRRANRRASASPRNQVPATRTTRCKCGLSGLEEHGICKYLYASNEFEKREWNWSKDWRSPIASAPAQFQLAEPCRSPSRCARRLKHRTSQPGASQGMNRELRLAGAYLRTRGLRATPGHNDASSLWRRRFRQERSASMDRFGRFLAATHCAGTGPQPCLARRRGVICFQWQSHFSQHRLESRKADLQIPPFIEPQLQLGQQQPVGFNLSTPEFSRVPPPVRTSILFPCAWPASYANRGS